VKDDKVHGVEGDGYHFIYVCTIDSSHNHFLLIIRLWNKTNTTPVLAYCGIVYYLMVSGHEISARLLTLGRNFGLTGKIAVFEGKTLTG